MEIFPDRPDMLSEQGFARALASFIGTKTGFKNYNVNKGDYVVKVDDVPFRKWTVCAVVKGLNFDEENIRDLMQVQEKLATTHGRNRKKSAYGVYPLNRIEFPVNYTKRKLSEVRFAPLGFNEEMTGEKILDKHPKAKEFKHITESWKEYPIFVDAKDQVMCLLPFTNSEHTGKVTEETKEVFVECTGINKKNCEEALNILVSSLADMGGEVYSCEMEYAKDKFSTPDFTPRKMKLNLAAVNKSLGLNLTKDECVKLLGKMGFGYDGEVLIPAYRTDILHHVDLEEDIAIAYGYENFAAEIPEVSTIGEENQKEVKLRRVRELLVGMQLLEVRNYHLQAKELLTEQMLSDEPVVSLANAVGEHNNLRNQLVPGMLNNLAENQHNEYPQNLFEVGRVFAEGKSETGILEFDHVAAAVCHQKADYTEARQLLDTLMRLLGKECKIEEIKHPSYIEGRCGKVLIDGEVKGTIGEINPEVLNNLGLVMPVVVWEINI